MQFHIQADKDKVIVLAEVTKIEVEDILAPEHGDDLYFRRVRFVTTFGDAIDVLCDAYKQKELRLNRVKQLKPLKPKPCEWQVYRGNSSDESQEQESD